MLQKWKGIINNWINCYSSEDKRNEDIVNIESLIKIISHLRENLNLDESKSSILEAHNVEEFILEKYPQFKFENGTVFTNNDDDTYLAASLLLFFVCVNSKDVNIKSAMCSNLSVEDQEIILKFSKSLMECTPITVGDVHTAIKDACSLEMTLTNKSHVTVAETPPVLRSLHSEVRRLEAALDAERFDRNFLQEELTRTNMKMEKLVKDKEQYKADIMNLRAQLSLCSGGDHVSPGSEPGMEQSARLQRQLKEMEERLIRTQELLDDAVEERDGLKIKVEDLKQDRDKWISLSQQESAHAIQLAKQLETERCNMQSLQELITDLQRHNRLNGLDTSLLECDDIDCSTQNMGHNLSVCSEACTNVIEVQLSEEKAKVDVLNQQIEALQKENEHLHFSIEEDNSNHEVIVKEKDSIIDALEKRLKEQTHLLDSLRKDYEDIMLSWETQKLKTEQIIQEKDEQLLKINEQVCSLQQEYDNLEVVRFELKNKVTILNEDLANLDRKHKTESERLNTMLKELQIKYDMIINEKNAIQNELREEKGAKDKLETEKSKLNENYTILFENNNHLHNEKLKLTQQLAEEKSLRQIVEEQISVLSSNHAAIQSKLKNDLINIENKLKQEMESSKAIMKDRECLLQQLVDEKTSREITEKEKDNLIDVKILLEHNILEIKNANEILTKKIEILMEKQKSLEQQSVHDKASIEALNSEKIQLIENLTEEKLCKDALIEEKYYLISEITTLKQNLFDHENIQNVLSNEKKLLLDEKEELIKCINMEKSVNNDLKSDMSDLNVTLKNLNDQYNIELKNKEIEMEKAVEDIKQLQIKCKEKEDLITQLQDFLGVVLDDLKQDLKMNVLSNDCLNKLVTFKHDNEKVTEKCALLVDIAYMMTSELKQAFDAIEKETEAVKEKDAACKNLEQQLRIQNVELETLQRDYKDVTLSYEKHKLITKEVIRQKDEYVKNINEHLADVQQKFDKLETVKDELTQKIEVLVTEMTVAERRYIDDTEKLTQSLVEEELKSKYIMKDKDLLSKQLVEEKSCRDILYNQLLEEQAAKDVILAEKNRLDDNYKILVADHDEILSEKIALTKNLAEEKALNNILNDQKNELLSQNEVNEDKFLKELENVEKKLAEEMEKTKSMSEDINRLTQEVAAEKAAKELIIEEKSNVLIEKDLLAQYINKIQNEKEELSKHVDEMLEKLEILEKQHLKEKELNDKFNSEKRQLLKDLSEEKSTKDTLLNDLLVQIKCLNDDLFEQKTIQDVLVNDKESLVIEKEDLVKSLQVEKSARDENENEKIRLSFKYNDLHEQYIADTKSKEAEIKKLVDNYKQLEIKIQELHQDKHILSTALEDKHRELQILQKENQSLTNDLNDVKVQLEIKVHSLKEKLTDNENLTDKLKKTYECQIDNLNMMINKLSNYLKDRASELEAARKEKDRLQQVIEENNKTIKALEDNVKSEKQNQEKLISDFESERQVLKNMVAVTESVMEDQKVTLNNSISERIRLIETLQEENRIVKEEIESEKKDNKNKLLEKESALKLINMELFELKRIKNEMEKETAIHKQELDEEIKSLKERISKSDDVIEVLNIENNKLKTEICNCKDVIKSLQENIKSEKQNQEKLISDFESEREVFKKMVAATESVMEDQKVSLSESIKLIETLQEENRTLKEHIESEKKDKQFKLLEKESALELINKELDELKHIKNKIEKETVTNKEELGKKIKSLKERIAKSDDFIVNLKTENNKLQTMISDYEDAIKTLEENVQIEKQNKEKLVSDFESEIQDLKNVIAVTECEKVTLNNSISERMRFIETLQEENRALKEETECEKRDNKEKETALELMNKKLEELKCVKNEMEKETKLQKEELANEIKSLKEIISKSDDVIENLKTENNKLQTVIDNHNDAIKSLKDNLETEKQIREKLINDFESEKYVVEYAMEDLKVIHNNSTTERNKIIEMLQEENTTLKEEIESERKKFNRKVDEKESALELIKKELLAVIEVKNDLEKEIVKQKMELDTEIDSLKDMIAKTDVVIGDLKAENYKQQTVIQNYKDDIILLEKHKIDHNLKVDCLEKELNVKSREFTESLDKIMEDKKDLENRLKDKSAYISEVETKLRNLVEEVKILEQEKGKLIAERDHYLVAARSQEYTSGQKNLEKLSVKEVRDLHHQVDNNSDISHSSMESLKTISDLEKIIHDKNRTITILQSDITYLKSLVADSETKLLDVTKELEISKENCHQLSSQLKKIVHQKNEELADLKKQVSKLSANETRASQIIKVSAKYQAIILRRIAEIKSSTVLKELTNYGNTNNSENELKRGLNMGSITMEDLENFLETTERHIKKCTDKQLILQKERDRLTEVNKINESEIINLKKFLTELSVSFQTFSSVKDLYAQKLSRVISVQRTVRREILNLDGHITDACMLKLERGYAAVMQDLCECTMNLERWVERFIGRTISTEKIKQAFLVDNQRASLTSWSTKNTGLEVQLDELEKSFQKLLEEISQAQKGEGARDAESLTVMELRADYSDKLNRMKAKMKQLYVEQIAIFKEKQKEEIAMLERELVNVRQKLAESSQLYEEHIRSLTVELWTVGDKLLQQKGEAEWLRRRQHSGSLMSLQHVHSSGLVPKQEDCGRPSGALSLRSLPQNPKREGRGLHMSDEEGEVFDNRFLKELATPRRESVVSGASGTGAGAGQRLSELQWRNSLCPPHLKSSYPAETQFVHALDEDEIKAMGSQGASGATGPRAQRKEVGITAYKKPGPPTPSKQAGRLSATDSELRESLRVETEPLPSRKTSTPSRIRSLFRSKNDTTESTPRTRRLSNIFRKKM